MGLPQVNILFKKLATSAIQRGARGIVALLLKDTAALGTYEITNSSEIPAALTANNKKQLELALIGGVNAPFKVIFRVGNEANWAAGLAWLETVKFDYLAIPEVVAGDLASIYTWLGNQRDSGKKIKAVLPSAAADKEYVVNFTTGSIVNSGVTYTAAQYCSRIAGLITGTPLSMATTFQMLPEVTSVQSYTKTQLDTAIDNGEFVIYHDGEKVKVARGVNSLKTTTPDKGNSFKKIKIVDILDQIYTDLSTTISDNYIGKYPNSYDNKVLLLTAINAYFDGLEDEQILDVGLNQATIDLEAHRSFLTSQGIDISNMAEQEIKTANTSDKVFILGNIKPLDAMEDININLYI